MSQSDPLTPEMRAVLNRLVEQAAGGPSRYALPFPEARKVLEAQREWWQEGAPQMAAEHEVSHSVLGRSVTVRHYQPQSIRGRAVIAYLHGGGFCVGSWKTHGAVLRWLAHLTGLEVVGIDYSLAPEHPFPAGIDDCQLIIDSLFARGVPVVVAGDSAGANLALVDAMDRRDAGKPLPRALLLYYGTFGPLRQSGSFARWGGGEYGLGVAALERYAQAYTPDEASRTHPRVAPLLRNVDGLPPSLIIAAGCDPLLDDSTDLHARYQAAGTASALIVYEGIAHGYLAYWRMLEEARKTLAESAKFIERISL